MGMKIFSITFQHCVQRMMEREIEGLLFHIVVLVERFWGCCIGVSGQGAVKVR